VVTGSGSANPESTSYAFDADGNQTQVITGYNSAKQETTTSLYDGDNNLTQQVDADGNTSDYNFDAVGEQTQAVVAADSSDPGTTTDSYDGDGNLTLSVNVVGDSTSYQYDADGNQTLVVSGFGTASAASVHYLYDASGNQIEEVDPDGNTTSYEYNADGEQTLMVQAYGSSVAATTGYDYDEDGNVTLQSNPNGTSIASSYDDQGNLTAQTWYASGGAVTNSLAYTYDEDGNILTASNDAGSYSYAYNADGEQTLVVTPSGVTMNYEYDSEGNVTQLSDSLGDTITSQYDADGNLTSRGYSGPNSAQLLLTFEYDGDGNLTGINRYSDLAGTQLVGTSIYAYNPQGLVSSIQHSAGSTTLASFSYNYDAAGELTSEVDNGTTTAYAYDATGQLTSAGPTNYTYDANGNPNQSTDSIGPNNELLSDGAWNYSYDTNGNQTGKTGVTGGPDAGLTWSYTYDASNQLIGATETNAQSQTLVQANYVYDVFNHLIESSVSTNGGAPVVTQYVYNGNTLWATLDASNHLQTAYIAGDQPDQFFAQYDASNGVAYYLTGHLGSVDALMNNAGQEIDAIKYDAYGNITSQSNPSQTPLIGFDGYIYMTVVGLYNIDHRWFNPQTQQWMTEDPLLLQPGPNPYEYVNNEPTNGTDPTGLETRPLPELTQGVAYAPDHQLAQAGLELHANTWEKLDAKTKEQISSWWQGLPQAKRDDVAANLYAPGGTDNSEAQARFLSKEVTRSLNYKKDHASWEKQARDEQAARDKEAAELDRLYGQDYELRRQAHDYFADKAHDLKGTREGNDARNAQRWNVFWIMFGGATRPSEEEMKAKDKARWAYNRHFHVTTEGGLDVVGNDGDPVAAALQNALQRRLEIRRMSAGQRLYEAAQAGLTSSKLTEKGREYIEKLVNALKDPVTQKILVGALGVWGVSHLFGVGQAADITVGLIGYLMMGKSAVDITRDMYLYVTRALGAVTQSDLNSAGDALAQGLVEFAGTGVMTVAGMGVGKGVGAVARRAKNLRGAKVSTTEGGSVIIEPEGGGAPQPGASSELRVARSAKDMEGVPHNKPPETPKEILGPDGKPLKAPRSFPHGFENEAQFNAFGKQLNEGLAKAGYGETKPIFQGSSVTGEKFTTGEAFDVGRVSDFDIALADPKLLKKAKELGIQLRSGGTRTGPLGPAELEKLGLKDLAQKLSSQAGRDVNFMIFDSVETATSRAPSIGVPK
jgi:RHS repeat-associated protein